METRVGRNEEQGRDAGSWARGYGKRRGRPSRGSSTSRQLARRSFLARGEAERRENGGAAVVGVS
jgi:hypothetical protein